MSNVLSRALIRLFPNRYCEPMPLRFESLARYNTEVYRGVIHTDEHRAYMEELQADWNDWSRGQARA